MILFDCSFDDMTLETYGQHVGLPDTRTEECAYCSDEDYGLDCHCGAIVCGDACFDLHECIEPPEDA